MVETLEDGKHFTGYETYRSDPFCSSNTLKCSFPDAAQKLEE